MNAYMKNNYLLKLTIMKSEKNLLKFGLLIYNLLAFISVAFLLYNDFSSPSIGLVAALHLICIGIVYAVRMRKHNKSEQS